MSNLVNSLCFSRWVNQFVEESSDRGIFARWFQDNDYSSPKNFISIEGVKLRMIKNIFAGYQEKVKAFYQVIPQLEQIIKVIYFIIDVQ